MSQNLIILSFLFALVLHLRITKVCATECGTVEFIDPKITRGSQTVRGAWPFLVALYYIEKSTFFCGATLISSKNVLTAAHCVQQKGSTVKLAPEDVAVLLGAFNLDVKIERGVQQRYVEQIYVHPDWKVFNDKYDADIAVLALSDIVDYTTYIRPICLPDDYVPVDAIGSIVGWGLIDNATTDNHESIPRHTFTKVLNDSYCYTTQGLLAIFASTRNFCAGSEGGSPNKGDSGGGLYVLSGSSWVQYGIISASLSNARGNVLPNSFSLYTNVRLFTKWIDETVRMTGSEVMTVGGKDKVKVDLFCNYEILSEASYKCSVWDVNVKYANSEVGDFTGTHKPEHSTQNVTEIWFWHGTLDYIPDGVGHKFPNLEVFRVGYSDRNLKLKFLKRNNFENMELLRYLDVRYNEVDTVDEDSLRDLPNLKYFGMPNNKLKILHKNTFERNRGLNHVNFNSNQLEFLHSDLFKNNPLEEAYFENNKLMMISIDLQQLKMIKKINFRGNICIDKEFNGVDNVTEFQTLLWYHCSGINERNLFS